MIIAKDTQILSEFGLGIWCHCLLEKLRKAHLTRHLEMGLLRQLKGLSKPGGGGGEETSTEARRWHVRHSQCRMGPT